MTIDMACLGIGTSRGGGRATIRSVSISVPPQTLDDLIRAPPSQHSVVRGEVPPISERSGRSVSGGVGRIVFEWVDDGRAGGVDGGHGWPRAW